MTEREHCEKVARDALRNGECSDGWVDPTSGYAVKHVANAFEKERAAAHAAGVASATKWTRELPTEPGTYWNAFRWPNSTRELYPEHSAYVVQIVTVFNVNMGGGSYGPEVNTLYVKGMVPAVNTALDDITKYEYDVWWMAMPTPAPPAPP